MNQMKNLSLKLLILLLPILASCAPMVAVGVGAGAGTGAVVAEDRRTSGTFVEDETIESRSGRRIKEQLGNKVHINVTSFNRIVLLTGEVPDETMKEQAERLVMTIQNVREIINEIAIAEKSTLTSRSNDALITSRVKGRFLTRGEFQINHIKVVTEDSTVYLLGMIKREEADNAAEIARSTSGVLKVVKAFEYLD
jgi:osmotically-inducible protein OsmY